GRITELVQHDGLIVARVTHRPYLRVWPRRCRLRQRRPRVPRTLFAELVNVQLVDRQATASGPVRRADLVPRAVRQPEVLVAVHAPDNVELGGQVRRRLDRLDRLIPDLAGKAHVLRDAEHQPRTIDVQPPQTDLPLDRGLAVLPCDEHENDPEAERAVRVELKRVNVQPLLPRQVRLTDQLGELVGLVAAGRLPRQRPERRRPQPRFSAPYALL